jgi:predicted ATPase
MQITRLTIETLRALTRLDVDLSVEGGGPRRRVIFLGANGAGKTTILDALAHAFQEVSSDAAGSLGAKPLGAGDVRNVKDAAVGTAEQPRRGVVVLEATLSDRERRSIRESFPDAVSRGTLQFNIGESLDLLAQLDQLALELSEPASETGAADLNEADLAASLFSFRDVARAALLDAQPPCVLLPADRGVLDERDDVALKHVMDLDPRRGCLSRARDRFAPLAARLALASLSGARSRPGNAVARMWKVLEKYFPEMPRQVSTDGLRLWFENGDGSVVPLPALSDGERAILLIFGEVALRAPEDGVILVDEIEQHLHPRWQRAALEGLAALVPSAQLILTTQSPYVAASAPDDVVEVGDWKRHGE